MLCLLGGRGRICTRQVRGDWHNSALSAEQRFPSGQCWMVAERLPSTVGAAASGGPGARALSATALAQLSAQAALHSPPFMVALWRLLLFVQNGP